MSSRTTFTLGFIFSLIGGVLILIGGLMSFMWFSLGAGSFGGMMGNFWGMMGGYQGMMGSLGVPFGFYGSLSLIGLVTGVIVIISASMFNLRPAEHIAWGVIILIFSVISFIDMGGFMIGAIFGITGGALAISCRAISETREK